MAAMRAAISFARYFLPPNQGASGSAGVTGVRVSTPAGLHSGMDKGERSHDHDPACSAGDGTASNGPVQVVGVSISRFGMLVHPGPRPVIARHGISGVGFP